MKLPLLASRSSNADAILSGNVKEESAAGFWQVKTPFDFENIGFSKDLKSSGLKYLGCGDCDLCPLGFQDLQSGVILLAADRTLYKQVRTER